MVEKLCDGFLNTFLTRDWQVRCEHLKKAEEQCRNKEVALEIAIEELIIHAGEHSDSDDSSDYSTEDSELSI
ncbi:hypothetical protein Trydic_g14858 [Trypoxylus dichotomus]